MELRDYIRILRRRWVSILVVAVAVTATTTAATAVQTPQYASSARLFITTSETDQSALLQGGQFSAQRVKSYADLINSRELASRVIDDLGLAGDPEELSDQVASEVVLDTVNLRLKVNDADPQLAQRIAQAYAEQLVELVRELETPPGGSQAPLKASIVDSASFSEQAVSPNWVRNLGLGVVLGLLLGFGLALLREVFDTRIRSTEAVEAITDAPILGAIQFDGGPSRNRLVTELESHAPRAEAFRILRTNLQFIDVDSDHKVFVVTSSVPGEGKTSTSLNLALSLAQTGTRTLLIGGDLRRPKAAERLGMDDAVGVTSVLLGKVVFEDAIQVDAATGMEFLASGTVPPNPAELLQSKAMTDMLDLARARYDVVLIDAPPLLPVTDGALLAAKADGAILVVGHNGVTRDQVRHSIERLAQVGGSLAGVLLNKVPSRTKAYGYGYGYGYAPEHVS